MRTIKPSFNVAEIMADGCTWSTQMWQCSFEEASAVMLKKVDEQIRYGRSPVVFGVINEIGKPWCFRYVFNATTGEPALL